MKSQNQNVIATLRGVLDSLSPSGYSYVACHTQQDSASSPHDVISRPGECVSYWHQTDALRAAVNKGATAIDRNWGTAARTVAAETGLPLVSLK